MIIAFKQEHLDQLDMTPEHRALAKAHRAAFDILARGNLASTVVAEGVVLGVLGAAIDPKGSPTECEIFVFPSAALKLYPVTFMRSLRQEIDRIRGQFDKIRAAGEDTALSRRFLSALGFVIEGPMTRAGCNDKLMWVMPGGRS